MMKQYIERIRAFFRAPAKPKQSNGDDRKTLAESEAFLAHIDHDSAYMRERNDNRFWKFSCVILFALLLVFVGNNSELADKLRVEVPAPVLNVEIDGETQEYRYAPIDQVRQNSDELIRDYVKDYVLMRETFIPEETVQLYRWGNYSELYWRTDNKYWRKEAARVLKAKYDIMMKEKRKRDVEISEPVKFGDGFWQLTATYHDHVRRKTLPPMEVLIYLRGQTKTLNMPTKHAHHNRIGWVVDYYSVTCQKGCLGHDG